MLGEPVGLVDFGTLSMHFSCLFWSESQHFLPPSLPPSLLSSPSSSPFLPLPFYFFLFSKLAFPKTLVFPNILALNLSKACLPAMPDLCAISNNVAPSPPLLW